MKTKSFLLLFVSIFSICLFTCCSDNDVSDHDEIPDTFEAKVMEMCRFISDMVYNVYLWADEVEESDYRQESFPFDYFYRLCLSDRDRYSFFQYQTEGGFSLSEFLSEGQGYGYGLEYVVGKVNDGSGAYVCALTQVYKDSPAYRAGLRRGDCVTHLGDAPITLENASSVSGTTDYQEVLSIVRYHDDGQKYEYKCKLSADSFYYSSFDTVFVRSDGSRVGYYLLGSFKIDKKDEVVAVARRMKESGITDLIIDLRENSGGNIETEAMLASLIAPSDAVRQQKNLTTIIFNDKIDQLPVMKDLKTSCFRNDLPVSLNLNRVVFLVSNKTVSCSESIIWSLMPYMEVVVIGRPTKGKVYACLYLLPEDFPKEGIVETSYWITSDECVMLLTAGRWYNCNGEIFDVSDGDGIKPTYAVNEYADLFSDGLCQLGDPRETLTAAALRYLSGEEPLPPANKALTDEFEPITEGEGRADFGRVVRFKK